MRERVWKNWKEAVALSIFVVGVMVLRLFYITRTTGPFIYADEIGYWSHAAHMVGYTWAGVMDGVSWYSFGYSFWLALTFLFSDEMVVMFRIAVVINMLMGVATYGLAYQISRRLLEGYGRIICGLVAFAVTSFPTYLFYSYTTMTETLVALLVWLLFYELISLEEYPCWWKGMILGLTAGYAYMVHNRLLAVVIAVVLCLLLLWATRKADWKVLAAFCVSIVFMLLLYTGMKEYLESMITNSSIMEEAAVSVTRGSHNTLTNMLHKVQKIFSGENLKYCILGFIGQIWDSLAATYLLLGVGVAYCVQKLVEYGKMKKMTVMYCYPALAFLGLAGMTAIAFSGRLVQVEGQTRIDTAFYGRYSECIFPILILLGMVMMIKKVRYEKKVYGIVLLCFACASVVLYFRLREIENGYLNIVSSVSIHIFHWLGEFSVIKCCIVAAVVFGAVLLLCHFKMPGQMQYGLLCLMLIFLFATTALYCMKLSIRGENDNIARYQVLFDYLNDNTQKQDIVYICDENKMAYDVQTRLVNKTVICVTTDRLEELIGDHYAVIREGQTEELDMSNYDICLEAEGYMIIRTE
ncbi:MAG: hypothetical protein LUI12_11600 [Clostridiales bacterium]|nr:hypothetical protein [Clostridiales bacterium]